MLFAVCRSCAMGGERSEARQRQVSELRMLKHCKPSKDGHLSRADVSNPWSVTFTFNLMFEVAKNMNPNFKFDFFCDTYSLWALLFEFE